MDSSFIVVAKTVMQNTQNIAALTYALSIANPELYSCYLDKLAELQKNNEEDFQKMDRVLDMLNKEGKEE